MNANFTVVRLISSSELVTIRKREEKEERKKKEKKKEKKEEWTEITWKSVLPLRDFLLGVGRLLLPTAALWLGVAHGREVRLVTPRTSSTAASGGGQRRGDAHAAGGRCDRWAPGVPLAAGSMLLLLLGATFSLLSFAVGPKAWWFDAAAVGCDLLTAQFRCWA